MYTMSQINHIKDLSNCGYRISEISKKTGADPKTIRKLLWSSFFVTLRAKKKLDHNKIILFQILAEFLITLFVGQPA